MDQKSFRSAALRNFGIINLNLMAINSTPGAQGGAARSVGVAINSTVIAVSYLVSGRYPSRTDPLEMRSFFPLNRVRTKPSDCSL
jgi:hypothetical protein